MESVIFRYRGRELTHNDITFIRETIKKHYDKGRTPISRILCQSWEWMQPNGKPKEYAARDLLLRLEEKGFVELPPRIRPNNNRKKKTFNQIPIFNKAPRTGYAGDYPGLRIQCLDTQNSYLWDYLIHHYHYLGLPTLVGEYIRHLIFIDGQIVSCLAWASAAWKIKARDQFIGWDENTKRKNLSLIANNTRFLILPWIKVKYLASKVLSLSLRQLSADWEKTYEHPIYLAETFVDISRFSGTCYQAANWIKVGQTKGSAKKGNEYQYHGQPKAIYLYPLYSHFRRFLLDDQG